MFYKILIKGQRVTHWYAKRFSSYEAAKEEAELDESVCPVPHVVCVVYEDGTWKEV